MAENMNIGNMINSSNNQTDNGVIEKYCYDNDPANCETYGGLYQWDEMMEYYTTGVQGICPSGWHLPTDDEWKILEGTVDSQYPVGDPIWNNTGWRGYDAGFNLKSTNGWYEGGNGSGFYGNGALPGGQCDPNGYFSSLSIGAFFWSSSDYGSPGGSFAWRRVLEYDLDWVSRYSSNKYYGFSARCLKD